MEEFIHSIPAAASSPYALAAYAIAAVIFLFAGARLRLAKALLARIDSIPPEERRRTVEVATGTVLPTHISPEQWIRNNRLRWAFLLAASILIVMLVIAIVAMVNPTKANLEDIRSRAEGAEFAALRSSYPLEPLELSFTIEYPMDQPRLKPYAERLRADIVSYLRQAREGRGPTSDSLSDEDVLFVVSNQVQWKPTMVDSERVAMQLLEDNTSFTFRKGGADLRFLSTSQVIADAIVTMKRYGQISQRIELSADFARRMFLKTVVCRNPVRTGSDVVSVSSLDLIGRNLTWDQGVVSDLEWKLTAFALRFSYDYGFGQHGGDLSASRNVAVAGQKAATVTADHVGLRDVVRPR